MICLRILKSVPIRYLRENVFLDNEHFSIEYLFVLVNESLFETRVFFRIIETLVDGISSRFLFAKKRRETICKGTYWRQQVLHRHVDETNFE